MKPFIQRPSRGGGCGILTVWNLGIMLDCGPGDASGQRGRISVWGMKSRTIQHFWRLPNIKMLPKSTAIHSLGQGFELK